MNKHFAKLHEITNVGAQNVTLYISICVFIVENFFIMSVWKSRASELLFIVRLEVLN